MKQKIFVSRAIFPEVLARLEQHFDVESNQEDHIFGADELLAKAKGKDGLFTTPSEPVTAALFAANPQLKAVCNMAVGYNNIDIAAATQAGVMATNTPDVLNETTADFGWALMMATARRITESEHFLRAGQWKKWSYDSFVGPDVHGATLGIIGMGRIGQAIARRSLGFDMQVLYHNRSRLKPEQEAHANNAQYVGKEELLKRADHVVLVLPYSRETHHTIGAAELALMKPTATLTNIARGGIVDDAALIETLRAGRIAAAGVDVFENEPAFKPEFLSLTNVVLTPHIASASTPTRLAMANCAADNLIAALSGRTPPNLLNPDVAKS
ncbi:MULTISPECIES: D-glycerate dehydrogenase [unclassified Herbaspirillum]|uniref:2-hydroxyacid dehydrogenase n=1 Tax=unclassified Herbaspirillum TaxID=2624150 RepID=UPI00114FBACC|nr:MULTISPECIES: D-glycerate dehydrogenase [unclassified Herbaspirillum]MBB5390955.1 glyoxylate reductase [Herbaspirillum sp. SJZ102]TQK06478.1 glyoxylate reductase [Herbaspirillum sp. SJZ130]TQK12044.1 glyoxylate reductase [Herbaspirillum sp. SJZ106]